MLREPDVNTFGGPEGRLGLTIAVRRKVMRSPQYANGIAPDAPLPGPFTRVISARMTPGRLTAHPCRRVTVTGELACHSPWLADRSDALGSLRGRVRAPRWRQAQRVLLGRGLPVPKTRSLPPRSPYPACLPGWSPGPESTSGSGLERRVRSPWSAGLQEQARRWRSHRGRPPGPARSPSPGSHSMSTTTGPRPSGLTSSRPCGALGWTYREKSGPPGRAAPTTDSWSGSRRR